MRLMLVPERLAEGVALGLGRVPEPLAEVALGMGMARCLMAGTHLGVFDALAHGPRRLRALAAELGCDPRALRLLLDALAALGYLRRRWGRYRLSRAARRWLVGSSPASVRDYILFNYDQWRWMDDLEERVREGGGPDVHTRDEPPGFWERYLRVLEAEAADTAPEVAAALPFDRPPSLVVDVGGAHGLYSAALCDRYPGLRATVLDLPAAADLAPRSDRIDVVAGDVRHTSLGRDLDGVLLFNLTPHLSAAETSDLLVRAHRALRRGGLVALLQPDWPDRGSNRQLASISRLLFFLTSGRPLPEESELRRQLAEAGFRAVRRVALRSAPACLLIGTRP